MKKLSKVLVLVLSAVMVLAMSASVFAAATADSEKGGPASITITLPTDNAGTDEEITYSVYKVFNATTNGTAIAYQIDSVNGDLTEAMTAAGFSVQNSNVSGPESLNADALAAIKAYAKDKVGDFKAKPSDGTLAITGLEYGYYYITTTTGAAVTVNSTKPNAEVADKNDIPSPPDKKATGVSNGELDAQGQQAVAAVGSTVNYSVDIVKVKGATNYVFHDVMKTGLQYNNDVAVTTPTGAVFDKTTAAGDTITVTFDNDWLASLTDGTKITITYSATVTSDALTVDSANNTASLDYGEGHKTDTDTVKVYTAKVTVKKTDGTKALEGAGFTLYKKNANNGWDSVKVINSTEEAPLSTFVFDGLGAGDYKLEETQVPAGYNKADDQTFTITADNTAANLDREITVVNNAGSVLPGTGGIGTTIFYVLGSLLVIGCGIVLVSRKRMQNNK